MINRQQALEIIEKFDFFQGQRAGRELWADKPREVQEDDLIHFQVDCELLKEFIESQPERPKGRWEEDEDYFGSAIYKCTACGEEWILNCGTPEENNMNFCPKCGADMRGEEE